ncbi:MAG: methyltransferase domain-containing protein [Huintestinicola sp.]
MSDWNSNQYLKFRAERAQPSTDLINRLSCHKCQKILDLGCGPGNSTKKLAEKFPAADILGIDSSEDMLKKARKDHPDLSFKCLRVPDEICNLKDFDLIFSNACIHWIPNHKALIPALFDKLSQRGTLAVQIPYIQKAPFYRLLNELVGTCEWKNLSVIHNFYNLYPEEYYDILSELSSDFNIWETTYYHTVNSNNDVIEWYKGSGLRPYLDMLSENEKPRFLADLSEIISENFPIRENGKIILKMPRLFFTATK